MLGHLPSPILSVAADVVKELEGEDAVFGLWTLFTKCKESLKDGRRLENISWRLWYREIAASQHTPSSSPGSLSPPPSEKRSLSPITPISEDGRDAPTPEPSLALLSPAVDLTTAHSWHGETPTPSAFANGRRLSTATMPMAHARMRPNTSVSVGRIILEILPAKLDVHKSRRPASAAHKLQTAAQSPPVPHIVQPQPVIALPTMQLPSDPSSARQDSAAQPASQRHTHLLPPAPTRALVTTSAIGPTAPEQSASAFSSARDSASTRADETLKPSDRRFFLQESPERDSPERTSRVAVTNTSDIEVHSPSSAASSHRVSDGASAGVVVKRPASRQQGRKNKEVARHVQARPALHRTHTVPHMQRQAAQRKTPAPDAKKTTFNIGSASSNGSHGTAAGPSKAPAVHVAPKDQVPTRVRPPSPAKVANGPVQPPRRGIVVSTSSEYETTDTDDDSEWASEDNIADDAKARQERQREETRIREAAEEVQRQRDMFAKVPKRSYSNLNRTRSGLLSQLLNPDPNLFPPNHPYRTSYSTQDMTQFGRHGTFSPSLHTSKSSAAVPLAAQVTAQAPSTNGAQQTGGYIRKGRPQGAEMEDSDSGDENPDNVIQVSHSLAQQKLAALADPNRRRHSDRPSPQQQPPRPPLPMIATAPIALGHPYNLPAPAAPMTPRTTRRQMLSTELSESLRRNLLWERQVSKVNMTAGARRGGLLGSGLRPLTAANGESSKHSDKTSSQSGNESEDKDEQDRERKRRAGVPRNRSWADDYHYAGW
ncbi:hypothetical protein B0H21DRAFT_772969 [Amylocystis lapponica]|nr:hypothetical protein B0H21DRAFT_772969 [Amylocystis lapponica]